MLGTHVPHAQPGSTEGGEDLHGFKVVSGLHSLSMLTLNTLQQNQSESRRRGADSWSPPAFYLYTRRAAAAPAATTRPLEGRADEMLRYQNKDKTMQHNDVTMRRMLRILLLKCSS